MNSEFSESSHRDKSGQRHSVEFSRRQSQRTSSADQRDDHEDGNIGQVLLALPSGKPLTHGQRLTLVCWNNA